MKRIILTAAFFLLSTMLSSTAFAANDSEQRAEAGVERYAIYIGSNYGGKGREQLLYAGSDAQNFQKTMAEIGGVPEKNSWLLIDPSKETVEEAIESVSATIEKRNNLAKRSEFLFYYSGHSTEDELLLGEDMFDYSSLKKAITEVPSDIHVVILDSCYSGNFIRTKGGQKKKPFLMDDSSVVKGHAYLSSSSEKESSQESDEIESSYFTNAMITGLRGAADTSGDNKVSLTELYSYAFNDTLSKTEESVAGPQHPNYNITLVGSGDLILSDISSAESSVIIAKEAEGRFIIRDARGKLISEINKSKGIPITMALSAGTYTVVVITETSTKQGTFILNVNDTFLIEESGMQKIARKETTQRGGTKIPNTFVEEETEIEEYNEQEDDEEFLSFTAPNKKSNQLPDLIDEDEDENEEEDIENDDSLLTFSLPEKKEAAKAKEEETVTPAKQEKIEFEQASLEVMTDTPGKPVKNIAIQMAKDKGFVPIQFSLSSSFDFIPVRKKTTLMAIGVFGTETKNILGFQTAAFNTTAEKNLVGVQAAGFVAKAGNALGFQSAGIFAKANNFIGMQTSGISVSSASAWGIQAAGLTCYADKIRGMQYSGIYNGGKEVYGTQVTGIANHADKLYGLQVSGIFNSANLVRGIQVASLVNYAKTLNGIQVGLINISKEGKGFGIGLINYIEDGVHDLGMTYDSDNEFIIQYQSGSKALFSTAGLGFPVINNSSKHYKLGDMNLGFIGLGTRFGSEYLTIDLEFLWKISSPDMKSLTQQVKQGTQIDISWDSLYTFGYTAIKTTGSFFNLVNEYSIPSIRLAMNLNLSKHLSLYGTATADIKIQGWNENAFTGYARTWQWESFYPSVSAGIKLR